MPVWGKRLSVNDEYQTPTSAWSSIDHLLPRLDPESGNPYIYWEPFFSDGGSGRILASLGLPVIHLPNVDFFTRHQFLGDIVITNPPFSKTREILQRLLFFDRPFVMILPAHKLNTLYVREMFSKREGLQIVIPRRRIHFCKGSAEDGRDPPRNCPFDSYFFFYRMNLEDDITFLPA